MLVIILLSPTIPTKIIKILKAFDICSTADVIDLGSLIAKMDNFGVKKLQKKKNSLTI